MSQTDIPEFAIVGHPNEGKSSVVSTLVEDDGVRIGPTPGETVVCQTFQVIIDAMEIIRFTDTPGFQNPHQTLSWMKNFQGPWEAMVNGFLRDHDDDPAFKNDCELLRPILRGAGIIFVVDGSRPVRQVDRAEMEILRLTGRPRMAIINSKDDDTSYLDTWKTEFRKHFNSVRMFSAHRATYAERITLLESLKSIDQDWEPALTRVISAFKTDWERRSAATVDIICEMLSECLEFSISKNFGDQSDEGAVKKRLQGAYIQAVQSIEKNAHQKIRRLFKQNIFDYNLPAHSVIREDFFSEQTWQVLGLSSRQLITSAGLAGGAVGAAIDVAAAGLTFGIFTAAAGVLGAGLAAFGGGRRLADTKVSGLKLGGRRITMGPNENPQFLYILIDRSLIFYSHVINWAHGRRDYPQELDLKPPGPAGKGFVAGWQESEKRMTRAFFQATRSGDENKKMQTKEALKEVLSRSLKEISQSDHRA